MEHQHCNRSRRVAALLTSLEPELMMLQVDCGGDRNSMKDVVGLGRIVRTGRREIQVENKIFEVI
jgi:hypothetical protein